MVPFSVIFCCLLFGLGTATNPGGEFFHPRHCCENRIVGGVDTDISQVPYQAALLLSDYYFCGAAIISEKFLVTGAHCILFYFQMSAATDDGLMIRVGSNHSDKGGVTFKVKNTSCHPQFDFDNYDYDICLIELEKSISFGKNIKPIRIGNAEPKGGEMGKVSGWGTLWEGGSVPDRLQSVVVPVTNRTVCIEAYEKISPVTERMFCAGEEGKDSCQGDSGGGLAINGVLFGIISTGYGCGAKNYPGVYTSVAHPEIRKYIKEISGV